MDFMQAVTSGLQNYVNFNGRSQRSAFWWWVLFAFIVYAIGWVIDYTVGITLFYPIAALGLLLPYLAVTVRRLHDTDRSGWFILLSLIPLVGAIILLVWYCQKGTDGPNRFGPDPFAP